MFRILLTLTLVCLSFTVAYAQNECVQSSRVTSGDQARIIPGDANTVRAEPDVESDSLGIIVGGEQFTVLDGVSCDDTYLWVEVQRGDLIGWTVEAIESEYWIQPLTGEAYDSAHLSVLVPESLAMDVIIESVDAEQVMGGMLPDRLLATFQTVDDVPLYRAPRLIVTPVRAFNGIFEEKAHEAIAELRALKESDFVFDDLILETVIPGQMIQDIPFPADPFIFAARRLLVAQPHQVDMTNGYGVAFVTMYGQDIFPVNNDAVFYNFVGVTHDEEYWVSFQYPVTTDMLTGQEDLTDNVPDWRDTYEVYIQQATESLNTLAPDDWNPSLDDLDTVVSSIYITYETGG